MDEDGDETDAGRVADTDEDDVRADRIADQLVAAWDRPGRDADSHLSWPASAQRYRLELTDPDDPAGIDVFATVLDVTPRHPSGSSSISSWDGAIRSPATSRRHWRNWRQTLL